MAAPPPSLDLPLCALITVIYRLINDVGPKIEADDVVTVQAHFIVFS